MAENNNQKPNFYDLFAKVGKIDGKLDAVLTELKDHNTRINDVEKIQDQMVGKISVWSSVFGFFGGVIISVITFFIKK